MAQERPRLEVCVDTVAGLTAARRGGADRVELCSALALDGLTPSAGLMAQGALLDRPVYAMIRPRGGDFVFTEEEVDIMLRDIDAARTAGLAGVVLGASAPSGDLDVRALGRLSRHAAGMGATLHRAFDLARDPLAAVDLAVDLGFERILTSGGAVTAEAGIEQLARLVAHAGDRLSIMAGVGVTPANAAALIEKTGVWELHGSFSAPLTSKAQRLASQPQDCRETRADIVAAVVAVLRGPSPS